MSTLAEVLKFIAEQQLIPFISSLVSAAIVYLAIPNDCWLITKMNTLTAHGFFWLVAGCFFLLINLVKYILIRVSVLKRKQAQHQQYLRMKHNVSTETEVVWDMVGQLTSEQLSCVYRLVKRKNRPVKIRKDIESNNWWKYNDVDIIRKKGHDLWGPYTLYCLGERLYKKLSTLYSVNGTIQRESL